MKTGGNSHDYLLVLFKLCKNIQNQTNNKLTSVHLLDLLFHYFDVTLSLTREQKLQLTVARKVTFQKRKKK